MNQPFHRPDGCLWPLLYGAAEHGDRDMSVMLLDQGANVDQTAPGGASSLMLASERGFVPLVALLLARRAAVNYSRPDGYTALFGATRMGHVAVVRALLDSGSTVDQFHKDGTTPFWVACQQGHLSIAQVLVEAGADPNVQAPGYYGRTPLQQAATAGHHQVVALLLRWGSVVDAADAQGTTALHLACIHEQENVVRLLLAAGASISLEDNSGRSAMDYVIEERHAAVRQILQGHTEAAAHALLLQDAPSGAAGQAEEGTGRRSKRAFRFRCNNPACGNTEESEQRLLHKCGRCRGVRYCGDACMRADWRAHKVGCRAPSLPEAGVSQEGGAHGWKCEYCSSWKASMDGRCVACPK